MLIYLALSAVIVVLDQVVKSWASTTLRLVGTLPVIPDVFHLTYAENTGAAFSLMQGGRWFFVVAALAAVGVLIYLMKIDYFPGKLGKLATAMVIGGAMGNWIDRVLHGYVVDLFEVRFINFAIFNVADVALTAGVVLLLIRILTLKEPAEPEESTDAPQGEPNHDPQNPTDSDPA